MLGLRGIGIMICLELMCVIESASDIGGLRYSAVPVHDPLSAGNTTESIDTENPKGMLRLELAKLVEPLMTFSSWAQVETNADALGDALGEAISRSDEIGGWDELARVRLVRHCPSSSSPLWPDCNLAGRICGAREGGVPRPYRKERWAYTARNRR